jgi:hypothetical protein
VIWCTGFGHDFSWIDLPGLRSDTLPEHDRGVAPSQPGLYFIGLPFLTKLASAFIGGVGEDAKRVVRTITARLEDEATNDLPDEVPVPAATGLSSLQPWPPGRPAGPARS